MGRRGLTTHALSKIIDRGNTYLNERLKNSTKELALRDVEAIAGALGIDLSKLMIRASRRAEAAEDLPKVSAPPHTLTPEDLKDDYDLAADQHQPGDEIDYDSY